MLAIDTSGVANYVAWLDSQAVALRRDVCRIYRMWAIAVHAEIAELTPQWSGNLAANWALDLGSASSEATYFTGPDTDQPFGVGGRGGQGGLYSRGMYPAVGVSLERARQVGMPGLTDDFYIHNPVVYADSIENDTSTPRVRAINRLPRSEAGKIAMVAHAQFKHSLNGQVFLNDLLGRTR